MSIGNIPGSARALALAFATLLLAALACQPQTTKSGSTGSSKFAGRKAADFTLRQVGGGEVKLSDHEGKVVVLNFWASW